ncbi:MAG: serine/threonine protein phosphatase, partial [Geminicoccaceae bacterium]|nr:serine/threonine protein phosphatase [Geminicoccaceae bacterium]
MFSQPSSSQAGAPRPPRRYRAIFISDLHLGSPGCKAECLLDFLHSVESEYLYLVGDVLDGWRLKKRWFWPERHNEILQTLLARARRGTRVVYLPGNHDEALRKLIGRTFGGMRILHDVIHKTADGRRLLVIHGDVFDGVCTDMQWLARLGSVAYETTLAINTGFNHLRRWLGLGYWPLSAFLKAQVKAAVNFVERYEQSLAAEARRRAVAGVVCGHVHKPEIRTIDGVEYFNDGDWVESCSALVEHWDGRLELLHWARQRQF